MLEESFGVSVSRWIELDEEGFVYGHPEQVEIDVVIRDSGVILVEITSHARRPDVTLFRKKAIFYEKKTGKMLSRLIIIIPYADEDALELSKRLQKSTQTFNS